MQAGLYAQNYKWNISPGYTVPFCVSREARGPHRGQRNLEEAEAVLLTVMDLWGRQGGGFEGLGPGSDPETWDFRLCTQERGR